MLERDSQGHVIEGIVASILFSSTAHSRVRRPPRCKNTQASLERGPCGRVLRRPANSQGKELSQR